jgi:asparagine synthase (glutamine-hydrolysing)
MCGIAGMVGNLDQNALKNVQQMSSNMRHRGPDGSGLWQAGDGETGRAVFAHRRLAIIDLQKHADQPMVDPATGNVIVFNGEIYNYRSIRSRLAGKGVVFSTNSDTEVLLLAYDYWGEEFVDHLRGMYAFAIWDARQKKVVCCRDRLGMKPLYFASINSNRGSVFVFASELRALLSCGVVKKKLDAKSVAGLLWNGFVPEPSTIVENIQLLPPASVMEVNAGGKIEGVKTYWSLPSHQTYKPGNGDYEEVIHEALGLHLESDVPVGIFLSGGIDSSAIACMASRCSTQAIDTFNIALDDQNYDESPYARFVASALKTNHHEIRLTRDFFVEHINQMLASLDQPSVDGLNTYFVSKAAGQEGLKVALAGTGGDELFGGYQSFREIPIIHKYSTLAGVLPMGIRKAAALLSALPYRLRDGKIPPQKRWAKLTDILMANGDLLALYQITYGLFTSDFYCNLLSNGKEFPDYGLDEESTAQYRELISGRSIQEGISALEVNLFLRQRLLRDADSTGMASSLEVRFPFLDHKLVEEMQAISPQARFYPLQKKMLLREIATRDLGEEIFNRPKAGFVLPAETWSRQSMSGPMGALMLDRDLCQACGLNSSRVSALYQAFLAADTGIYWSSVWAVYGLLWWCRRYQVFL